MSKTRPRGFTLIELMIVVAIVGILAALAYPSYQDYIRKTRRSDAVSALTTARLQQEQWRASNKTYATKTDLDLETSPDGYYSISIGETLDEATCALTGNPTATAYAIKASATTTGGQNQDSGCANLCTNKSGAFYPDDCIVR